MKSGEPNYDRNEPAVTEAFSRIKNRDFIQIEFHPKAALVKREPMNGLRMWKEYKGEPFDEAEFTKVEGYWDHEHCSVCWFDIEDGHTYWSNKGGVTLLCDECYQA